ncbi:MAG: hypothetical protein M1826_006989 [Phylliscum demangeonii]|nr:MAG: hypothetical protein M1826_006989 [Phylliscum demangeonii]
MSPSSSTPAPTKQSDEKTTRTSQDQQSQAQPSQTQNPAVTLEEDDEFEDFPIDDWTEKEMEVPGPGAHLWDESWADAENNEEFAAQLKEEMKKVEANKKG